MNDISTCYACDRPALFREHVPPKCFFPEKKDLPSDIDLKVNLITVPACEEHNLGKSKDDEYLVFVIVGYLESNQVAQDLFSTKLIRAMLRRPSLLRFYSDGHPAQVNGRPSWAYYVDRERFDRAFVLIARALYYHHFNSKWAGRVSVISPVMVSLDKEIAEDDNRRLQNLKLASAQQFADKTKYGDNEEVFFYQVYESPNNPERVLRLIFYSAFEVIALFH